MAKWTCDCGMDNTTEFCVACGKKYQSVTENMWVCSCGKSNTGRFCVTCGQQRTAGNDKWLCECGVENGGKFCVQCGKPRVVANLSAGNIQEAGVENAKEVVLDAFEVSVSDAKSPEKSTIKTSVSGANVCEASVVEDNVINTEAQDSLRHDFFDDGVKSGDSGVVLQPDCVDVVSKSNKKMDLKTASIFVLVLLIVGAYFGYGKYLEYRYDNRCSEYIAVMDNVTSTMQDVGSLSGDKSEEARQKSIDSLNAGIEKLKNINEFMTGGEVPEDQKGNQKKLADLTAQNITYLENAVNIISYDNMIYGSTHIKHEKEFSEICEKFTSSDNELRRFLSEHEDLIIQNRKGYDLLKLDDISDNLKRYCKTKLKHDKDKVAEDNKKYAAQLKAANDELMKKSEVVFLTSNVIRNGDNKLDIVGAFHNGTKEMISGLQDMQVDIILKDGDEEVLSIKDYQYSASWLGGFMLLPGGISRCVITIPADITDKEYDNYEVNVHKIKWKVRRIVKK